MPLKVGFAIVFLLLLLGCDGNGKSDGNIVDSVDLAFSSGLPTSYVELGNGDVIIISTITPAGALAFTMSAGLTGTLFNEQLIITTIGSDINKTYLVNEGEASVVYIHNSSGRHFSASSGSVNIIAVQPVGGRITCSFIVLNGNEGLSGSFVATREQ